MSAESAEVLHRIYGAIDVARQMVTRSAEHYEHMIGKTETEIRTALADAHLALSSVAGALDEALKERDQPAA